MVTPSFFVQFRMALGGWWRQRIEHEGFVGAGRRLAREAWEFLRDSTPERKRQRYGDMDYDWEHRVNTTSGSVGWRERLLGVFHSAYQPTEPAAFQEMISGLPVDLSQFTFADIGSGKGRTLLMASEYPFCRVLGLEILPELHRAAQQNIRDYKSATQRCTAIESICVDASEFEFPETPLVLYLFNPLPPVSLDRLLDNLWKSLQRSPRAIWMIYYNPLQQEQLQSRAWLRPAHSGANFAIFQSGDEQSVPH